MVERSRERLRSAERGLPRPEALLEGLMRVQDKIRTQRTLRKDRDDVDMVPVRTGRPSLPEEVSDLAKATAYKVAQKEAAKPAKV